MVLAYLPTYTSTLPSVGKYSSTMVRIWLHRRHSQQPQKDDEKLGPEMMGRHHQTQPGNTVLSLGLLYYRGNYTYDY
jgi:hypothetical protein